MNDIERLADWITTATGVMLLVTMFPKGKWSVDSGGFKAESELLEVALRSLARKIKEGKAIPPDPAGIEL
jgi:hypothetical protein